MRIILTGTFVFATQYHVTRGGRKIRPRALAAARLSNSTLRKPVDKQAAREEGAQIIVPLDVEKIQKPSFPSDAVERTAAVFAALAASTAPLDAATVASGFRQGRRVEKQIAAVLTSLARLGHVAVANGGEKFEIRRAA